MGHNSSITFQSIRKTLFLITLCSIGALNAQTIITDRPDQTESSSAIKQGSLQIESGVLIGFTEANNNTQRELLAPSTLFRIGILKGIELRVLSQFESTKSQNEISSINGISDLEVGTKIQILQKDHINTEIAFLSHLIMPTGTTDIGSDSYGTINKLSISHQLNQDIGIGYNLGYNYFGSGSGDLTYSIAIGIGISDKASVYIEPYGDLQEFDKHISNIDAGVTYLLKDNFQLDFSFGTGINYSMNYISLGCSWNISRAE